VRTRFLSRDNRDNLETALGAGVGETTRVRKASFDGDCTARCGPVLWANMAVIVETRSTVSADSLCTSSPVTLRANGLAEGRRVIEGMYWEVARATDMPTLLEFAAAWERSATASLARDEVRGRFAEVDRKESCDDNDTPAGCVHEQA